jgi:hypothetical protein
MPGGVAEFLSDHCTYRDAIKGFAKVLADCTKSEKLAMSVQVKDDRLPILNWKKQELK